MNILVTLITIFFAALLWAVVLTFGFALLLWFMAVAIIIMGAIMLRAWWYRHFHKQPEPSGPVTIEVDYKNISPDK